MSCMVHKLYISIGNFLNYNKLKGKKGRLK